MLSILFNDGSQNFTCDTISLSYFAPYELETFDFDEDNELDIIIAYNYQHPGQGNKGGLQVLYQQDSRRFDIDTLAILSEIGWKTLNVIDF